MQVKRFFAADMRQAMNRVKEELGADASILSTRKVAGGIELTAALDYNLQSLPARANPALEAELRKTKEHIMQAQASMSLREEVAGTKRDRQLFDKVMAHSTAIHQPAVAQYSSASQPSVDQQELAQMRSELLGLRELLEMQLGTIAWGSVQHQQPKQAELWKRLQKMGLPAELVGNLMQKVASETDQRQAWRMVLAHLAHELDTPAKDPLQHGGVIALVGPAGMGKTTTLAKLAARYVLEHGAQNVAIVSMDSFRIGAQEQLKTLGRILNVSVSHVEVGQSLEQALHPLQKKRLVLIDTAGLPAQDPMLAMQLDSLAARGVQAKNYLVLAATSQAQVLKAAWHAYKRCGLAGCIITKLDEAVSMGEALGMAICHNLAVAYTTDGPRIPDDIQASRSHQLVSRAVRMQNPDDPGEQEMAAMYATSYQAAARQVG
ncbi:flagellar biosynthesis protein FlhF [Thiopseudomonas acetoxidans]|uniref:Flagellar biosynthesis protein FlhF n=1 Tax=Thiopseudomonas acetoxidans TaxID=3041622 RepID=A0ABT7SMT0_9GAMM|nr:flagellar biosynthesis protein FlhF [Thiopseudomonas sp. CY1220]MDM7857503.1 flagellar biosynthesis protein FlhF [Thiopseudomonas sp. CY1220]